MLHMTGQERRKDEKDEKSGCNNGMVRDIIVR